MLARQRVFVLVGFPGSGKSTLADRILRACPRTVIVCKDSLRVILNGGSYIFDPTLEPFIHRCAQSLVHTAVEEGLNVIIDETNMTSLNRSAWIDFVRLSWNGDADNPLYVKCLWCTESTRNAEYRMVEPRGFDKDYWQKVIDKMKEKFEPPLTGGVGGFPVEEFDFTNVIFDPLNTDIQEVIS
jgi:tRNA uridine 5-carbamoylmethylation protein Kti12